MPTPSINLQFRRRVASLCAWLTLGLAGAVLAAWLTNASHLVKPGHDLIPMAPSSALLFLGTSFALLGRTQWREHRVLPWMATLLLGLVATAAVAALVGWLVGDGLLDLTGLAGLAAPVPDDVIVRMSPLTRVGFVLLAAAMLMGERAERRHRYVRAAAAILLVLLLAIAALVLLSYLAGASLRIGGGTMAMSMPSAVAFVLLGGAEALLGAPAPLENESASGARLRLTAIISYAVLVASIATAAAVLLRVQLSDARTDIASELSLIADQKVAQIAEWRAERISDGAFLANAPFVAADIRAHLRGVQGANRASSPLKWIRLLGNGRQYDRVRLFDGSGRLRAVLPDDREPAAAELLAEVAAASRDGRVRLSDLYLDANGRPHLSVLAPVRNPAARVGEATPVAVLALEADAQRQLYPLIQHWPTPSPTAENLLVRAAGSDVVFLNALRHAADSALLRRRPLRDADLPAAWAARGEVVTRPGVDYRGVPVLAATRSIPDSPWRLVTKVDQVELYAPLRRRVLWTGLGTIVIALSGGLVLAGLWRARDLAMQRDAEARLRESEARFRDVFESANVGKSITLPDGRVNANPALAEMLGYDRAALTGLTWQQLTPPEDVAAVQAELAPLLRGERDRARFTKRYVCRDGSLLWGDVSTTLRRDADGTPAYFITTVVDISARVRSEEALRRSEDRFAAAFHVGPACMTITRIADGLIVEANETFLRTFECTRDEVIGSTSVALNMLSPDERAALIETQLATGGIRNHEVRARTKSGRLVTLLTSSQAITLDGEPHHVTTMVDLSDQKAAEASLRESESRFSRAFRDSPIGTFISSMDGRYVDVNQAFCRLTGYPREALLGQRPVDLGIVTAADRQRAMERIDEAGGSMQDIEMTLHCRDGSVREVQFATTIIDLHGVTHRLSVCEDLTRRKRAEARYIALNAALERRIEERTADLRAANEELETFAYSVSHDLRAPLRAVDGYISLLAEQFGDQLGTDGRQICATISASARNLGRLIDELLEYSRTGRVELQRAPVDMAALARAAFEQVAAPGDRGRIDFHLADLPMVIGDGTLLHKLWVNLIDNAVKFSGRQPRARIEVGARPAQAGEPAAAGSVFYVKDNGAGFDMQYAGKLFGIFERLHAPREFPGTGVGLAIVQRVVLRHGGRVWATAAPGAGATVYFQLGTPEGESAA